MQRLLAPDETTAATAGRDLSRPLTAACAVAATTVGLSLCATRAAHVPWRDPGGVVATRAIAAAVVVTLVLTVDLAIRAARAGRPFRAALATVCRKRATAARAGAAAMVVVSFYATYGGYRNLKSVVALLEPGRSFDAPLEHLDRILAAGHEPASLLHGVLGSGASAHVLAAVYLLFFGFIPAVLAATLVLVCDLRVAVTFTTALSLTWLLGAVGYFALPSLGPFHSVPATFAHLPATSVTAMQHDLLRDRAAFIAAPRAPGAAQSIGAFPSLHVAVYATALLGARAMRLPAAIQAAVWLLTIATVASTVYFGWHYLPDDVAGVLIAVGAVKLAGVLTGVPLGGARAPGRVDRVAGAALEAG